MQGDVSVFANQIFFEDINMRLKNITDKNGKLIHYTSSSNALKIIRDKTIWMRDTRCMNDLSEMSIGIEYLDNYLDREDCRLVDVICNNFDISRDQIMQQFRQAISYVSDQTYICSFSEHYEDKAALGKLSMWRAYAQKDGVAIVMNLEPFKSETNELSVFASPVEYGDESKFAAMCDELADKIGKNASNLSGLQTSHLLESLMFKFVFAMVCFKHFAFEEENEWRVIYIPRFQQSKNITKSIEDVRGVIQTVYKIPLQEFPGTGFIGTAVNTLISKILIGPSGNADVISDALIELLTKEKCNKPSEMIIKTNIPLRV